MQYRRLPFKPGTSNRELKLDKAFYFENEQVMQINLRTKGKSECHIGNGPDFLTSHPIIILQTPIRNGAFSEFYRKGNIADSNELSPMGLLQCRPKF